ncbi:hypothetical protein CLOM_g5512, partial [Closterium sp. NIES-68]
SAAQPWCEGQSSDSPWSLQQAKTL